MSAAASPTVSSTVGLKNVVIAPLVEDTKAAQTETVTTETEAVSEEIPLF